LHPKQRAAIIFSAFPASPREQFTWRSRPYRERQSPRLATAFPGFSSFILPHSSFPRFIRPSTTVALFARCYSRSLDHDIPTPYDGDETARNPAVNPESQDKNDK
jgi:hypothetical protein